MIKIYVIYANDFWLGKKVVFMGYTSKALGNFLKEQTDLYAAKKKCILYNTFELHTNLSAEVVGKYEAVDECHIRAYMQLHLNRFRRTLSQNTLGYILPYEKTANCHCGVYVPPALRRIHRDSDFHKYNVQYLSSKLVGVRTFLSMNIYRLRFNYQYGALMGLYLSINAAGQYTALFEEQSFVERGMWPHWLERATRKALSITKNALYLEYLKHCKESSELPLSEHNLMMALKASGAITYQRMVIIPDCMILLINAALFRGSSPLPGSIEMALHNGEALDLVYSKEPKLSFMEDCVGSDFFKDTIYEN